MGLGLLIYEPVETNNETTTRNDQSELRRSTDALRDLQGTGVKYRLLPNSGLLLRLIKQKDLITKLGPTRDSNPGPLDVQPYMLPLYHRGS
ncbi:unnamed protein product, partial [Brenthis ino]